MLRLLADENLNNRIVRALRLREPSLDLVRVQDVGLRGADDPVVLDWAASEGRIVLTHDASTMTRYAYERVEAGNPMPGVIEVAATAPLRCSMCRCAERLVGSSVLRLRNPTSSAGTTTRFRGKRTVGRISVRRGEIKDFP